MLSQIKVLEDHTFKTSGLGYQKIQFMDDDRGKVGYVPLSGAYQGCIFQFSDIRIINEDPNEPLTVDYCVVVTSPDEFTLNLLHGPEFDQFSDSFLQDILEKTTVRE